MVVVCGGFVVKGGGGRLLEFVRVVLVVVKVG
jgi:hypothetical protein